MLTLLTVAILFPPGASPLLVLDRRFGKAGPLPASAPPDVVAAQPLLQPGLLLHQPAPVDHHVFWGTLVAHGVLIIAGVWFGYQLLRAAERLLLPLDLARKSPGVLLGVETPQRALAKAFKLFGDLAEKVAEILKATRGG